MSSSLSVPVLDLPTGRLPLTLAGYLRLGLLLFCGFVLMGIATVLMVLVSILTLFRARRFCTEVISRGLCRSILWLLGVKVVVHQEDFLPETQTVYISNHTSSLDCFILPALGLPNARFFLWGGLRKNPFVCIMGYLTGTIWTVSQTRPQKRARIFQRAEDILRRTGESVYLSPEGQRTITGEIGHFNKGAFHLATNLRAPLLPFYISTPRETDPGMGIDVRPGVVHVYFQPPIRTEDWKLADLDRNRIHVRELFVRLHQELKPR